MDNPGKPIFVGPNPFNGSILIAGLISTKSYGIALQNGLGQETIRKQVEGQQETVIYPGPQRVGIYYLRLYDETKGRVIGSLKLISFAGK